MNEQIKAVLKKHAIFIGLLMLIGIASIFVIIYKPVGPPVASLEKTFFVFSLGLQATVFIYMNGIYLMNRWRITGKSNKSTFYWGIAFLIYGILFIGVMFQALGYSWANMNQPVYFFIFRQFMIIWAALMYYGMATIIIQSKKYQIIPTIAILVFGYIIFYLGLFVFNSVEFTMYIFLYTIWTPICLILAYMFYLYGKAYNIVSPKISTLGFVLCAITYCFWAPFHFSTVVYIYYIWFSIFNISLAIIFIGFILLPYEIDKKVNKTDSSTETPEAQ
jgi:hypothetical protein